MASVTKRYNYQKQNSCQISIIDRILYSLVLMWGGDSRRNVEYFSLKDKNKLM
jgi:hypothetical protein